jgi:hypothetical protein
MQAKVLPKAIENLNNKYSHNSKNLSHIKTASIQQAINHQNLETRGTFLKHSQLSGLRIRPICEMPL